MRIRNKGTLTIEYWELEWYNLGVDRTEGDKENGIKIRFFRLSCSTGYDKNY